MAASMVLLIGMAAPPVAPQASEPPPARGYPWLPTPRARPVSYPELFVDAAWVTERLARGGLVVLDVRRRAAFERGHLPGALHAPPDDLAGLDDAGLARELGRRGVSGAGVLVLVGDAEAYAPVGTLFWLLERAGCPEVRVLDGGLDAWTRAGGALEARRGRPRARRFEATPRPQPLAGLAFVRERFGRADTEIIDVRESGDWEAQGYEFPPAFAAGHIPHSLPFDFSLLVPGDGRWPEPRAARKRFLQLGPRRVSPVAPEAEYVVAGHDARDPRVGLAYLLLRAMGFQARVFAGGLDEWRRAGEPLVSIATAREVHDLLVRDNPSLDDRRPRDALLFDVRGEADYALEHLPGAYNLGSHVFGEELEGTVAREWPGVDRARAPFIVYCYGRECIRSREATTLAARAGFHRLVWFRDGVEGWIKGGYRSFGTAAELRAGLKPR